MSSGLVLIDKPKGFTSHDVVAKLRGIAGTRRVGHAGTLDPMATGLLLVGVNAGTKLLTFLVGASKTYEATLRLGASTVTDDAEGELVAVAASELVRQITDEQIEAAIDSLRGSINQVPSSVSAIKVDGKRAHERVRAGEVFELASREVTISQLDVTEIRRSENAIAIDIEVRDVEHLENIITAVEADSDVAQVLQSRRHQVTLEK